MEQELVEPKACLAIFEPIRAKISAYKAENESLVFDYADPKGNKEARSHIYKLRLVKGVINEAHKSAKAEILQAGRQIDAAKNEMLGDVEEMIDVHNQPLLLIEKEKADAEAARLKAIADAEAARIKAVADAEAKAEAERLAAIEAREAAVKKAEADNAKALQMIADKEAELAAEAHARQEEALRIDREKRIAEEAKAKAAADAKAALEAAEQKRLADIAAAEAKVKAEAEAKELAERRKAEAEAAKKAAEAAAEKKRQENKKHQVQIRNEIGKRFAEFNGTKDPVQEIYDALIAGTIPHVKIEY